MEVYGENFLVEVVAEEAFKFTLRLVESAPVWNGNALLAYFKTKNRSFFVFIIEKNTFFFHQHKYNVSKIPTSVCYSENQVVKMKY